MHATFTQLASCLLAWIRLSLCWLRFVYILFREKCWRQRLKTEGRKKARRFRQWKRCLNALAFLYYSFSFPPRPPLSLSLPLFLTYTYAFSFSSVSTKAQRHVATPDFSVKGRSRNRFLQLHSFVSAQRLGQTARTAARFRTFDRHCRHCTRSIKENR